MLMDRFSLMVIPPALFKAMELMDSLNSLFGSVMGSSFVKMTSELLWVASIDPLETVGEVPEKVILFGPIDRVSFVNVNVP